MSTDDGKGLSRWSRLKRKRARGEEIVEPETALQERQGAAAPVVGPAPDNPVPAVQDSDPDGEERELTDEEKAYVETLPEVDDLNSESDFKAFMDKRVPEFLRRRALRKLWLSDPAFSFLDGMNEYDEDYSMMAELAAGASSYRPDQGGYSWREKPKPKEEEELAEDEAEDGAKAAETGDSGAKPSESVEGESMVQKANRVQDRGGSSVRAQTYTANPYYQAPGMRSPIPDEVTLDRADDEDDLGDAEDEFG